MHTHFVKWSCSAYTTITVQYTVSYPIAKEYPTTSIRSLRWSNILTTKQIYNDECTRITQQIENSYNTYQKHIIEKKTKLYQLI